MSTVTLRYWAAAKQAAGVAEETISAETLAAALEVALSAREQKAAPGTGQVPPGAGADLRSVLARSSFLVDGTPVGGRAPETVALREAAVVEVLPPFAGG
jgi:molybdopterin synthase sulfur carrier subunit